MGRLSSAGDSQEARARGRSARRAEASAFEQPCWRCALECLRSIIRLRAARLAIAALIVVTRGAASAASQLDPSHLGCVVPMAAKNRRLAGNSRLGDDNA
jgi:hypothetical protein